MTKIKFVENNEHYTLNVEGHSGYAESGADIVCSAISILVHSFAEYLAELDEEDKLQVHILNLSDGFVSIAYDDPYGFSLANLQMLKIGFYALTEQYPKNIFVEWGETIF